MWFLQKRFPDTDEPRFIERKFNKTRVFATAKWKKIFKNSFQEVENDFINTLVNGVKDYQEEINTLANKYLEILRKDLNDVNLRGY